jgi:hypothetical protein
VALNQQAIDCTFCYGNENENHVLGTGFFVHERIISTVKKVEFVSNRMSYIIYVVSSPEFKEKSYHIDS